MLGSCFFSTNTYTSDFRLVVCPETSVTWLVQKRHRCKAFQDYSYMSMGLTLSSCLYLQNWKWKAHHDIWKISAIEIELWINVFPLFWQVKCFPIIFWLVLFLGQKKKKRKKKIDHDCYLCSSVSAVSFSFWLLLWFSVYHWISRICLWYPMPLFYYVWGSLNFLDHPVWKIKCFFCPPLPLWSIYMYYS